MTALEEAFAAAKETPLDTIEISHSALTGGVLRFVSGYQDIQANIEDSSLVTFSALGFGTRLPNRNVDGSQDLIIQMDNVSREAYAELKAVFDANRTSQEFAQIIFRFYLESDLSAPAGQTYTLRAKSASVNHQNVILTASYSPLPNITWPRLRYFPSIYPWLRHAG